MMHVERMQPHFRNQVCANTYFILKLTSFAMHMMTQEKSAVSFISEGLFQLWFDCWWCIRRVTHKLFSHRLPHEHTSPHSNKALERSNKWKRVLRFWWCMPRGCSCIFEIKYVSILILFRSLGLLQCIWCRKKKSAVSLISEGLFQLWFDCWWCIRRVTHKLFSHRLPHDHTSPHSNKVLERSNNWKHVLRFWWCMSRGCSRIFEIKYVSIIILFRNLRLLQCIWWRKKKVLWV